MGISFRLELARKGAMSAECELFSRQISYDALANARHVIEKGSHHRSRKHVDCKAWISLSQQPDDRMAADKVADPHVRHDQNWTAIHCLGPHWHGPLHPRRLASACFDPVTLSPAHKMGRPDVSVLPALRTPRHLRQ